MGRNRDHAIEFDSIERGPPLFGWRGFRVTRWRPAEAREDRDHAKPTSITAMMGIYNVAG